MVPGEVQCRSVAVSWLVKNLTVMHFFFCCSSILGDEIRRLVTETLIPLVTEKIQARRNKKKLEEIKKDEEKSRNVEVQ